MIISWILAIATFLLGYYFGQHRSVSQDIKTLETQIRKRLEKDDIGPVRRPTAEKIYKMNNPKIEEEEKAMAETLKEVMK